jgi:hypothetical protein
MQLIYAQHSRHLADFDYLQPGRGRINDPYGTPPHAEDYEVNDFHSAEESILREKGKQRVYDHTRSTSPRRASSENGDDFTLSLETVHFGEINLDSDEDEDEDEDSQSDGVGHSRIKKKTYDEIRQEEVDTQREAVSFNLIYDFLFELLIFAGLDHQLVTFNLHSEKLVKYHRDALPGDGGQVLQGRRDKIARALRCAQAEVVRLHDILIGECNSHYAAPLFCSVNHLYPSLIHLRRWYLV